MEQGCLGIICQFDRVKPLFSAGIQCRFQSCDSPLLCRVRSEKKKGNKNKNKRFPSGQLLSFIFEPLYQGVLGVRWIKSTKKISVARAQNEWLVLERGGWKK